MRQVLTGMAVVRIVVEGTGIAVAGAVVVDHEDGLVLGRKTSWRCASRLGVVKKRVSSSDICLLFYYDMPPALVFQKVDL